MKSAIILFGLLLSSTTFAGGISGGGSGSGNVTGAASSTDIAVTRFSGTGGKTIQNSSVTLDSNGQFNWTLGTDEDAIFVKQSSGQSSPMLRFQNNAGNKTIFTVTSDGDVVIRSLTDNVGIGVSRALGGSANIQEWRDQTDSAIASVSYSGTITAPSFVGPLTGTASGNTAYTANNHGVVFSGSGNTMTVKAPDASTVKVLVSGGASADPTWSTVADSALTSAATTTPGTASSIVKRDASGWILDNDPSYLMVFKEDFLGYQSANATGALFNGDNSGGTFLDLGGDSCPDSGHIGCAIMKTGTTTTGRAGIYTGTVLVGGGGAYVLEWDMNLSALSNGTDRFTLLMGFCDVFSSNNTTCSSNSLGEVEYTDNVNSGNLVFKTKNGGTTTTQNSSTAMATGNHKFQIQVNAAATLSTLYLDGVSVTSSSTNIPTATNRPSNVYFSIVKSLGTTSVSGNLDYAWLRWAPTTPR